MFLNIYALKLSMKKAHPKMTFGYHRSEILGAFVSIIVLWVLLMVVAISAIERLFDPPPIESFIMLIASIFGIVFNLIMAYIPCKMF